MERKEDPVAARDAEEKAPEAWPAPDGDGACAACPAGDPDHAVNRDREDPRKCESARGREILEDRALGCLLGQFCGDSLGSIVESMKPREIAHRHPDGVRLMQDNPSRRLKAGQPTDDSEMAMCLARTLVRYNCFRKSAVEASYRHWLATRPVDASHTACLALARGMRLPSSMSNGALMRISPLGIFATSMLEFDAMAVARCDASITHVNRTCLDANAIFVAGIRRAILTGDSPRDIFGHMYRMAQWLHMAPALLVCMCRAQTQRPPDYLTHMGFVLIALQNALYELLHAPDPATAIMDTIRQGGDTDTNAAICGALLGAVHGTAPFPAQWTQALAACELRKGNCSYPRPEYYWPTDLASLARDLVRRTNLDESPDGTRDDSYDIDHSCD